MTITEKQVIGHDASRSQWQEYALEIGEILHIFPSGTQSMGDRGSKRLTRVRGQVYTYRPNLVVMINRGRL